MSETAKQLSIVYVWDADYPWDVRTEKTCMALTAAGHTVHIVARNSNWSPTTEVLPEGIVHRMKPWRWAGQRIDETLGFPAFFSPRWHRLIRETVQQSHADLIIARDLPLCPTAIAVGRKFAIPVILDMAENYPAMMRDRRASTRSVAIDAIVRNPRLTEMVERYCVRHADWTLTVVEESSSRLASIGGDPQRMSVVSNTPPRARAEHPFRRASDPDGKVTAVYLGLLETTRGIGELIDAIRILRTEHGDKFRAVVIGSGRDSDFFVARARDANILDNGITFLGRLPHDEAIRTVAGASLGIIPHHATESWNTTIPNKLFDYMAAGLPVVSSDAAPCVRVIREAACGEIFQSGNAASLAAAITRAAAPVASARLGSAGRTAVRERYNWEHDTGALLGSVARVTKDANGKKIPG